MCHVDTPSQQVIATKCGPRWTVRTVSSLLLHISKHLPPKPLSKCLPHGAQAAGLVPGCPSGHRMGYQFQTVDLFWFLSSTSSWCLRRGDSLSKAGNVSLNPTVGMQRGQTAARRWSAGRGRGTERSYVEIQALLLWTSHLQGAGESDI